MQNSLIDKIVKVGVVTYAVITVIDQERGRILVSDVIENEDAIGDFIEQALGQEYADSETVDEKSNHNIEKSDDDRLKTVSVITGDNRFAISMVVMHDDASIERAEKWRQEMMNSLLKRADELDFFN